MCDHWCGDRKGTVDPARRCEIANAELRRTRRCCWQAGVVCVQANGSSKVVTSLRCGWCFSRVSRRRCAGSGIYGTGDRQIAYSSRRACLPIRHGVRRDGCASKLIASPGSRKTRRDHVPRGFRPKSGESPEMRDERIAQDKFPWCTPCKSSLQTGLVYKCAKAIRVNRRRQSCKCQKWKHSLRRWVSHAHAVVQNREKKEECHCQTRSLRLTCLSLRGRKDGLYADAAATVLCSWRIPLIRYLLAKGR